MSWFDWVAAIYFATGAVMHVLLIAFLVFVFLGEKGK